jgi:DNA-directed RNA polymerase-3 subunit RPC5
MTVKASVDGEDESADNMATRISSAQAEPWQKLRYIDEDSVEAWEAFRENLFIGAEAEDGSEEIDLLDKVPKLSSALNDAEYLDAISAPRDAARLSRSKRMRKDRERNKKKGKRKERQANGAESDSSSTLSDPPSESESSENGTSL